MLTDSRTEIVDGRATFHLEDGRTITVQLKPGDTAHLEAGGVDTRHRLKDTWELARAFAAGLDAMLSARGETAVCCINREFAAAARYASEQVAR